MINKEYEWIYKEIYIKVIIKNNSQKLRLNVLILIKYNVILEMLWLYKKNGWRWGPAVRAAGYEPSACQESQETSRGY